MVRLAIRPVGAGVALSAAAVDVAVRRVRGVGAALDAVGDLPPRLLRLVDRAERIVAAVEVPATRGAAQLDEALVDDLMRSARAAPPLMAAMLDAVARFDVFLARADGARNAADGVLRDVAQVTSGAAVVLAEVSRLVGDVDTVVASARGVSARADGVVSIIERLANRTNAVLDDAAQLAAQAQEVSDTAYALIDQARPVADMAVGIGQQAAEPARALLAVMDDQADDIARLAPRLVDVVSDLVDRLPGLLRSLDEEVLPALKEFEETPGDVRALKGSVEEMEPLLGEVEAELAGLPGSTILRRRGKRSARNSEAADPPSGSGVN